MEANTNVLFNKVTRTRVKYLLGSLFLLVMLFPQSASAQCAMCRAVLQTGDNNAVAEGINNGIVYLMAVPYILVAGVFFFVYRKMKS
ncbi:MAG: hypothetical protein R3299_04975 [Arenibacter sp.]|nr:hypothetical protein [Arenibacter sp.]